MSSQTYDYAIIGAGAGGLQLIQKMMADPFFREKKILVLEPDAKNANDRTWCFWEKGETNWDHIATHTWSLGQFINQDKIVDFELAPYRYKMVRSARFYARIKEKINQANNVDWVNEKVTDVLDQKISTLEKTFLADHIFDSRIPQEFHDRKGDYHSLIQHFKGWFIKTENPVFDPDTFTMMDYRLKWKDSTSFTYVLPISKTEALVEFTLFNDTLLENEVYDDLLQTYIKDYLKIERYEITEVEQGQIPMSDYPFHKHHSQFITKIGTAGGWVRPSSGYSFKNADRYSSMMIKNIKNGNRPEKGIATSRFRTYDSIFLKVLSSRNDLGEDIFTRLYTKPDIHSVFRFLDEESGLSEDIKVMFSLNRPQFWNAFLSSFWR